MKYHFIHREWPEKAPLWYVMIAELGLTIAVLVLFGLAQPDLYRTQLWQAGDDLGFNSSPKIILYAYANYKPLPNIPFVWSQTLTNFNVAISVISLFFLLTKMIAVIMHVWYPIIGLFYSFSLTALYAASVYGQMGPDYINPQRPSPVAWYIAKPCTVAANPSIQKSCQMAKGTFAVTVIMLAICLVNLGLSIWAMVPNEADKKELHSDDEEESPTFAKGEDKWEMQGIPPTPRTATLPYTPRTMAFNTLERKLPLRQQYS